MEPSSSRRDRAVLEATREALRGAEGGSPAAQKAGQRQRQRRLEAVATRAKEEVVRALEAERTEAACFALGLEVSLESLGRVSEDADLWLSKPIQRCLSKLTNLSTHNLDSQQREVLSVLASCHQNLKEIGRDLKAFLILERRVARAGKSLEGVVDWTDMGNSEGECGATKVVVCSEAAERLQRKRTLMGAYAKLMRPPVSPALVRALRDRLGQGSGKTDTYEELDTLAHGWLEEWVHLTSILEAIFGGYYAVSTQSPGLMVEAIKVVEVHENIAEDFNRVMLEREEVGEAPLHSMFPVLLEAASASMEISSEISRRRVQENLVDLLIKSISCGVKKRVRDVSQQAFYEEATEEARKVVLGALLEDLYCHRDEINFLFPKRYNMPMTITFFYSEHLAFCLRDLMERIQGTGGAQANFSNADVLSLVTWVEKFASETFRLSMELSVAEGESLEATGGAQEVKDTINGELLSQLDGFRKLYVTRSCAKLKQWMTATLEKEASFLTEMTVEVAVSLPTPLVSSGPIDVFSAIQSELHTMLEEVSDPTLAAWSACAMAELILEHSEGYEAVVEGLDDEISGKVPSVMDPRQMQRASPAADTLRRNNSSPAAFVKSIKPLLGRPKTPSSKATDNNSQADSIKIEQVCMAANNCFVYYSEAKEVETLVEAKLGAWDLSSSRSSAASLKGAERSATRFGNLMKSSVLRFHRSCNLAVDFLVSQVIADMKEVTVDLFQEQWLGEGCKCIKTVSATFHDYCIDFAEYLKPDVYAHFLQQLFDHLIEIYLSGLYQCYGDGIVKGQEWKRAVRRDIGALTKCATLLFSLHSGLDPSQTNEKLKQVLSETSKMLKN